MMISLDRYSKNILELLLESESPLTSIDIANQIDISPRMVRYRLKPISNVLDEEGMEIQVKPNSGIFIDAAIDRKIGFLERIEERTITNSMQSPRDRRDFIKFFLLICDTAITTKLMRYELGVSRVTILKDLDQIESWFEEKNIQLVRRPGYGIELQGNEVNIREAIVDYLLTRLGSLSLAKLCRGSNVAHSIKPLRSIHPKTKDVICDYLSAMDISYAWSLTTKIEKGLSIHLTDNSFITTVLSLAIMIDRIKRGKTIQKRSNFSDFEQKRDEYYLAQTIAQRMDASYSFLLSDLEKSFIEKIISHLDVRKTVSETIGVYRNKKISQEAVDLTQKILSEISIRLHPYLFVDPELKREFGYHIQTLFDSFRFPSYLRSEIIENIKLRRPYTFSVAQKAVKIVEEEVGIDLPGSVAGQLAVLLISAMERISPPNRIIRNVLIVNDSGYEISDLIRSRLESRIPEIDVIKAIGPLELLNNAAIYEDIDGIISTIKLESMKVPYVLVSHLLSDADIVKIKDVLNIIPKSSKDKLSEIAENHLWSLLSDNSIDLDVEAADWEDVVEKAGLLLLNNGAIYPKYIKAMRDLILDNGPYVVSCPGVALLHARPDQGAKRTALSLIRLKEPVVFGHPVNDPVDLAFALSTVDSFSSQVTLKEYVDLIYDQMALDGIRKAKTKEEIINILRLLAENN